jgi:Domain of unknown function (DUF4328)
MDTYGAGAGLLGLALLLLLFGFLLVFVFFLIALQKALSAVSEENRKMPPGQVWLLLIPLFNIVWAFIVVTKLADSFSAEFERLNISYPEARPTFGIGITYCILGICSMLPEPLGDIASLASFVCWIIYWIKVNECRKLIDANRDNMMLDAERGVFHGNSQNTG